MAVRAVSNVRLVVDTCPPLTLPLRQRPARTQRQTTQTTTVRASRGYRVTRGYRGCRVIHESRGYHVNRGYRASRGYHVNHGYRANRETRGSNERSLQRPSCLGPP